MKKRSPKRHGTMRGGLALVLVVAGISACPQPTGLELRRLTHDDTQRYYYLHVPGNLTPETSIPLVIALHRFTETGARMARMTGFNRLADSEGFIAAYPNGRLRRFNAEAGTHPDDAAFVLAMVEDIATTYPVDRSRIYVTGASNGGFLAYRLACAYPEVFAAAAPVMAAFLQDIAATCSPGPLMPMIIIHGDTDPVIPYRQEEISAGPGRTLDALSVPETVAFWATRNGIVTPPLVTALPDTDPDDGTTATMDSYLDDSGTPVVAHIRVHGGGHTWPGGTESVPSFIVGRQSRDFSASEVIWEFFSKHQRHEFRAGSRVRPCKTPECAQTLQHTLSHNGALPRSER